jgi:hypothetical protein
MREKETGRKRERNKQEERKKIMLTKKTKQVERDYKSNPRLEISSASRIPSPRCSLWHRTAIKRYRTPVIKGRRAPNRKEHAGCKFALWSRPHPQNCRVKSENVSSA